MGAIIDPTLYRANHSKMMQDKELLEAALPLYRLAKRPQAAELSRLNESLKAGGCSPGQQ